MGISVIRSHGKGKEHLDEMMLKSSISILFFTRHDRFQVHIYSAHVLISITFAVFEYLDMALATENKILRFSRAVLPYETRSSNLNLALILFFCGHTN